MRQLEAAVPSIHAQGRAFALFRLHPPAMCTSCSVSRAASTASFSCSVPQSVSARTAGRESCARERQRRASADKAVQHKVAVARKQRAGAAPLAHDPQPVTHDNQPTGCSQPGSVRRPAPPAPEPQRRTQCPHCNMSVDHVVRAGMNGHGTLASRHVLKPPLVLKANNSSLPTSNRWQTGPALPPAAPLPGGCMSQSAVACSCATWRGLKGLVLQRVALSSGCTATYMQGQAIGCSSWHAVASDA